MTRLALRAAVLLAAACLAGTPAAAVAPVTARIGGTATTGAATTGTATTGTSAAAGCAAHRTYFWHHLARCGYAGAANTGYRLSACPGHRLAVRHYGTRRVVVVRRPHQVISCADITGCLDIRARGVVIRDVTISCTSGRTGEAANGTSVINVADGASALIDHVRIDGLRGVHACVWHQGVSATIHAVNCSGVDDGVFSWSDTGYSSTTGDHVTVADSYFHAFTTRTANGHIDGFQTEGAAYGVIRHNTFLMTSDDSNGTDSAIAIWDSLRSSHDFTISDNLIAGGGFAVYAEDYSPSEAQPAGAFSVRRITLRNNRFSRHLFGCVGYYGVWYPRGRPTDGWRRSGNRLLETGADLDHGNPSSAGRSCT